MAQALPVRAAGHHHVLRSHRRPARPAPAREELELRHRRHRPPREQVVPVTGQPEDTRGLAAAQAGSWLAAAARRIATGNVPGHLDGLFARHVLAGTPVAGLNWNVSPLSPKWLGDNRDRFGQAPALAAIGYGLACP